MAELLEQELMRLGVLRRVALSLPTLPGLGNLLAHRSGAAVGQHRVDAAGAAR
jgi:hypothetical protein